jgi:type II secretory pathway pseudopilin PulG
MRSRRQNTAGGFTLVEIAMTAAILALLALMLSAGITSSRQMDSLAREKILANNAIRAYIEDIRRMYPGHGDGERNSMWQFLDDPRTPADYLPAMAVAANVQGSKDVILKDPRALVLKCVDETGAAWGPGCGTLAKGTVVSSGSTCGGINLPFTTNADPWLWTDATMTTTGAVSSAMSATDKACCGVPAEDVDGDNAFTTTGVGATDKNQQLLVPTQITISWQTESSGSLQGPGNQAVTKVGRQSVTVYATFGFEH